MRQYRAGVLKGTSTSQLSKATVGENMQLNIRVNKGNIKFTWTNITAPEVVTYEYNFDLTVGNTTYNGGYFHNMAKWR